MACNFRLKLKVIRGQEVTRIALHPSCEFAAAATNEFVWYGMLLIFLFSPTLSLFLFYSVLRSLSLSHWDQHMASAGRKSGLLRGSREPCDRLALRSCPLDPLRRLRGRVRERSPRCSIDDVFLTTVSGIFNYSCQSGKQITELSEVFRAHSSPVGGLEMDERVVFSYERNRSCGSSSEKLEMTREHLVLIFHKACLWDRKSGKLLRRFEHHAPVSHIRLLGHRVVIVYSNVVRFFFVFSFLSIRFLFFFFSCVSGRFLCSNSATISQRPSSA